MRKLFAINMCLKPSGLLIRIAVIWRARGQYKKERRSEIIEYVYIPLARAGDHGNVMFLIRPYRVYHVLDVIYSEWS